MQTEGQAALVASCGGVGCVSAALTNEVLSEETLTVLSEQPAGTVQLRLIVSCREEAVWSSIGDVLACGNVVVTLELSGDDWETLLPSAVRAAPRFLQLPPAAPEAMRRGVERLYNSGRYARAVARLAAREAMATVFSAVGKLAAEISLAEWLYEHYGETVAEALLTDGIAAGEQPPACLCGPAELCEHLCSLAESDARYRTPEGVCRCAAVARDGVLLYADRTNPHPVTGEYAVHYFTADCLQRPYRWLLFDLDGTLTDPALGITRSVQYALRRFDIAEADVTRLYRFIGPPLLDSFREFYGLSPAQAQTALQAYREYYAVRGIYENDVYPGIADLLYTAQRAGYRVLMATSKPEMYACRLMRHFGLTEAFAVIAGADMGEKRADKAAVIRSALEREGITDPSDAVMIGDRHFDIRGGQAFGMPTIGVVYGYGTREELTAAGADTVVNTVADLRRLLLP